MYFILCSLTFVICFAVQVNSQLPEKPIGEWSPDRYFMYPNPWENADDCRTTETSGLCDYNEMLTSVQRKDLSGQPEMNVTDADKANLCKNVDGEIRIMVTVVVMKKIGPNINDYRAAAIEFAKKFRPHWNLHNCSVILVVSKGDNTSFLDAGSDVVNLLTANVTDRIDQDVYKEIVTKGLSAGVINKALVEIREELEAVALLTTVPPSTTTTTPATEAAATTTELTYENGESSEYTPIIIGIIIPIIGVSIVAILIVIFIKYKKRADARNAAEAQHLSPKPANV